MDLKTKYEGIIISAIQRVEEDNKQAKKHPVGAHKCDIRDLIWSDVDAVINEMAENGDIKSYQTLNSKAYEVHR